jgi:DNA modification methylase
VWDYAGVTGFREGRGDELAVHPTVKPIGLVEDAIKDCSRRADIVLDIFGGSGTTLIAAERCGRTARLLEIDPTYCDTILGRFRSRAGGEMRLLPQEQTYETVAATRGREGSI